MAKAKLSTIVAVFFICAFGSIALGQDGSGVVVLKCSWEKERIRPRPSLATLASHDELVQQSSREQQLAAARSVGDRGKVAKLETQITNHKKATAEASQTELPRDGYRYKFTLQNQSTKTIASIDWDYLFLDPTTQEELGHHQFVSDETIKPGKRKEISVLYLVPPVKVFNARTPDKRNRSFIEQVVVVHIQYSDGSSWQRP